MKQLELKSHLLAAAALVALVLAAYANTYNASFHLDDYFNIIENPLVVDMKYFLNPSLAQEYAPGEYFLRRIFGFFTFAVQYQSVGENVFWYHAINTLIHLAATLLVYGVTFELIAHSPALRGLAASNRARWCAGVAAALFAAHPVQTQAVTYIVQRFASMAAMLCFAAIYLYLRMRRARGSSARWALMALALACAMLAVLTKENAALLPAFLLLIEFAFFDAPSWRKRLLLIAPFVAVAMWVPVNLVYLSDKDVGAALRLQTDLSRADYFLTQLRVMATYLRLLVLPVGQNLDYEYAISTSLGAAEILSALLHAGLLGAGGWMLVQGRRGAPRLLLPGFGICFYYLAHAAESSVFPIRDVIFEHRLYLPSLGAFIAVAWAAMLTGPERQLRTRAALCMLVICALVAATLARNETWRTERSLWQDNMLKSPNKARPLAAYGLAQFHEGQVHDSIDTFKRALAIEDMASTHNNLGNAYLFLKQLDEAEAQFKLTLTMRPKHIPALNNMAQVNLGRKRPELAAHYALKAIRLAPDHAPSYVRLGKAFIMMQQPQEAIKALNEALRLSPTLSEAHRAMADALDATGDAQSASMHRELANRNLGAPRLWTKALPHE